MPKRTTVLTLTLPPRGPRVPATRWLSTSLRAEILDGRLGAGSRLPATRDLARQYGLSRGTIVSAFEELKSEGYLVGTVGSGTYVNETLPDELFQVSRGVTPTLPPRRAHARRFSEFAQRVEFFHGCPEGPARAFRTAQPALDLFPTTLWAQLASRRIRRATAAHLLQCESMGYRPLREAITDYLTTSRGVRCTVDQVAIVSGVQEALDLVARIFLNPGDRVCMENPGYNGASRLFDAFGVKLSGLPVDREGMAVPPARLRDVRLAHVTPGHQFPLGVSMSLPRRLALLEWARTSGAFIFEDDYDSEYRYSGRPLPALQGLDRNGAVLFAGTFNKVMFPSLRLGYLVLPPDLVDAFAAVRSLTMRHAPLLQQAVLCDFISEGHLGRHIRRMREVYAERLSVLLEAAQAELAGLLEISDVEAGLQTVGWLCGGIDDRSAARAAHARGIEAIPLSWFTRGRKMRGGLHLGFAAVDGREIRRGVRELRVALEGLSR